MRSPLWRLLSIVMCAAPACVEGPSVVGGRASVVDAAATRVDATPDDGVATDATTDATDGGSADVTDGGSVDGARDATSADVATCPADAAAPDPVAVAVGRVKNLLVGLAATPEEVRAVADDRAALGRLVSAWMALPAYREKMLRFFATAFQQNQFNSAQLAIPFHLFYLGGLDHGATLLENVQQSFARTALALVDEGRPFTETMTTTRYMMTPAVMAAYALLDSLDVQDNFALRDLFQRDHPTAVTLQSARPIALADSVNPASPDFMTFYHPGIDSPYAADCPSGIAVYPAPASYLAVASFLFNRRPMPIPGTSCFPPELPRSARLMEDTDFTAWRMVTVRPPTGPELPTPFYDLPAMRAGHELVAEIPRVGFFTTPAFIAQWPTNQSNLARVIANQTMIVALGRPFDLSNPTAPPSLAAIDTAHAAPGTACHGCHLALDPMRQYFRQALTLTGSVQRDPGLASVPGQFAFHGVSAAGAGLPDLGARLAAHPAFAAAWVQRLCTYATSAACDESDPEFVRLTAAFRDGAYDWSALVRALFASPLVTGLAPAGAAPAPALPAPLARQAHLCALLDARLGLADVCGLGAASSAANPRVQTIARAWPSDQYSRGQAAPTLVNAPSMFTRGGLEALCVELAVARVDADGSPYRSADPAAATAALVAGLMGVTDARAPALAALLRDHLDEARRAGASPEDALRSTFVVACTSAAVAAIGL